MVEHSAVNRVVVGSSPTRGVFFIACMATIGSMVKRLRHRPFTAVTGVQIPLESFFYIVKRKHGMCSHFKSPLAMGSHRVNRFSPLRGSPLFTFADVAQLAEQLICNQQVNGSSPFIGLHFYGALAQLVRASGS